MKILATAQALRQRIYGPKYPNCEVKTL